MGLGQSVLGDNTRIRLMTSVSDEPRKSPGGRPMLRTTGGWDSGI